MWEVQFIWHYFDCVCLVYWTVLLSILHLMVQALPACQILFSNNLVEQVTNFVLLKLNAKTF